MTQALVVNFAAFDMAYESNSFEIIRVSPQGKQKFTKFSFGVSKQLWALNPVSPAALEEEIHRLALSAIRQLAIKARTAGESGLQLSYNLVDILQTILPESVKLTKDELENWLKANATNFRNFLISRGHADDATIQGKVNRLVELLGKATAPNPGWKQINLELILALVAYLGSWDGAEGDDGDGSNQRDVSPETTAKLLAKVEALMDAPALDVDAL